MKRSAPVVFALLFGGTLCLGTGALLGYDPLPVSAESGPTYASSLPKNLDLNDVDEEGVRKYYAALDGHAYQGTDLLKALRPILQDFTYYSYDNCWKIYEITDREWVLSPAEEMTQGSYDPSTGLVSNYKYGSSNSYPGADNPYVHTLYRNRDADGVTIESGRIREWGDHTQTGGTNREHVWCQSHGFKASSGAEGPAGTDVHHLISGDGYVNGTTHNNNPYGFVDLSDITDDPTRTYPYCAGNYSGAALHPHAKDESAVVFEPQDSDKGDIARACFYMVACYNNLSGNQTITQFNPNLTLCDYATSSGASEISSSTKAVGMGILSDLLAWHRMDPVDDYEIHRNNLIYNNFQHNRNPFVDFPDWVEAIWGSASYDPITKDVSYNPAPVGYASPISDDVSLVGEEHSAPSSSASSSSVSSKTHGTVDDVTSYTLVTEASSLRDGDKVVLGGLKGSTYYGISPTQKASNRDGVALSHCDGTTISPLEESVCELTLRSVDSNKGTWYLYDEAASGYLYAASSSANQLKTETTPDDNAVFRISFEKGVASIVAQGTNSRCHLRFNTSPATPLFSCYSSATMADPLLFKSYTLEADAYGKAFLDTYTKGCDELGIGSVIDWTGASNAFAALSIGARELFRTLDPYAGSLDRHLAAERYDHIVYAYGTATCANFMNRAISTQNGARNVEGTRLLPLQIGTIAIVLAVGCAGVALFYFNRRKQTD